MGHTGFTTCTGSPPQRLPLRRTQQNLRAHLSPFFELALEDMQGGVRDVERGVLRRVRRGDDLHELEPLRLGVVVQYVE